LQKSTEAEKYQTGLPGGGYLPLVGIGAAPRSDFVVEIVMLTDGFRDRQYPLSAVGGVPQNEERRMAEEQNENW